MSADRIAIIGAGLGGALMACYLGRAGYNVAVYERRSDPRKHGFLGGRSINLALSERGLSALRQVGLAEEVLKKVIPMPGRMIHSPDKSLHFQAYSKDPTDRINSVSRGELSILLINAAEAYPNVKMHFDHRCAAIDFKGSVITFEREDTHETVGIETDRIIGADGAYSIVRLQMMLNTDRFEYRQDFLQHGYKELTIPPAAACGFAPNDERLTKWGGFAMNPNALHIWPRGSYMMIALPNQDQSFTCTCFWPFSGFEALKTDEQIRSYFEEHFPDAVPLMPTLIEDFKRNPTSSLVTVKCWPWHMNDNAVLLGDAAHAIVPFYGQGMNCAFEDCTALMHCIDRHKSDWRRAFEEYAAMRKPNADAIAEMALLNFIEMRDKTASALFRGKKKLEHALHAIFPNWFMPLYNMISFSTIPYSEAQRRAARQNRNLKLIGLGAALIIAAAIVIGIAST
jgi:kynurenine 3-monooxygenase